MPLIFISAFFNCRLFTVLIFLTISVFSASSHAELCWMGQEPPVAFGNVTVGKEVSTTSTYIVTCQAAGDHPTYYSICLSTGELMPFHMVNYSTGDEMEYYFYPPGDRSDFIGILLSGHAVVKQMLSIAPNQQGSVPILFDAVIPGGQTEISTGSYNDSTARLLVSYNYSDSESTLIPCDERSEHFTTNSSMQVSALLEESCIIESVSSLNFGSVSMGNKGFSAQSQATIRTRCPAGVSYQVGLSEGSNANLGESGFKRNMCNKYHECIGYELYQEPSLVTVWGNTSGQNTMVGSGGETKIFTVYGEVPNQKANSSGHYTDVIIVTLDY